MQFASKSISALFKSSLVLVIYRCVCNVFLALGGRGGKPHIKTRVKCVNCLSLKFSHPSQSLGTSNRPLLVGQLAYVQLTGHNLCLTPHRKPSWTVPPPSLPALSWPDNQNKTLFKIRKRRHVFHDIIPAILSRRYEHEKNNNSN